MSATIELECEYQWFGTPADVSKILLENHIDFTDEGFASGFYYYRIENQNAYNKAVNIIEHTFSHEIKTDPDWAEWK